MAERISDRMSEYMPERMSNRMSEYIYSVPGWGSLEESNNFRDIMWYQRNLTSPIFTILNH